MINNVNPNGDITQAQAKRSVGVTKATRTNGINFANETNMRAKERLARFKRTMRNMDGLQAINRFEWHNCPAGLRSALIERVLYYRGQGMFFYDKTLMKYMFLPYALTNENEDHIDMYGQYQTVKPFTFNGKAENNKKANGRRTPAEVYIGLITKVPIYDMVELEMTIAEKGIDWVRNECCIIIRDYTQQISEYTEPRSITQEAWIEAQAELPIFFRTALLKALQPNLLRVADQGSLDAVLAELQTVEDSIISGRTIIPVTSLMELQDISTPNAVNTLVEATLKAYDSLDLIRQSHLGINTKGAFQKQSGMQEGELSAGEFNYVLHDGYLNRNEGLEMIKLIWEDCSDMSFSINGTIDQSEMPDPMEGDEDNAEDEQISNENVL